VLFDTLGELWASQYIPPPLPPSGSDQDTAPFSLIMLFDIDGELLAQYMPPPLPHGAKLE
jgi:hypothetical protein